VLPFESIDIVPTRTARKPYRPPQLPLYVEPLPDEALLSWLLRLASRLRVPMHTLAYSSFGVDDRGGHTRWWLRPHPWSLARISERTGVPVIRLRKMTLSGYQPVYRDDEAGGRFCGRRFEVLPPDRRLFRFAVCGACIKEDDRPYLRHEWLIGWTAVCAKHNVQLIERCQQCRAVLRVARWTAATTFAPGRCTRCGESVRVFADQPAHPSVSALQEMMIGAKLKGLIDLAGLGQLTWREFVALADILLSGVWRGTTMDERAQVKDLYTESLGDLHGSDMYDGRHDSLRFLAWLLDGWPHGLGPQVAQEMLRRWLFGDREFASFHLPSEWAGKGGVETYAIGPDLRTRVQEYYAALLRANPEEPNGVRSIIETRRGYL
jgi:TniQ protein